MTKMKRIASAALSIAMLAGMTGTGILTNDNSNITVTAASVGAVSEGKEIAEANGIVLDSDADAAELAVLNTLNGGILPQIDFDNAGSVSHIGGLISELTVRNQDDAKAVIASVANLLGIQDADAELSLLEKDEEEFNTIYTFAQMHDGIRVCDAFVAVFVNAQTGKADFLNSSFITDCDVDTVPGIAAPAIPYIIKNQYGADLLSDAELVIVPDTNGKLKLAYAVAVDDLDIGVVYISAVDGSVLYGPAPQLAGNTTYTYNGYNSITRTNNPVINIYYSGSPTKYYQHDYNRNIFIVSDNGGCQNLILDYFYDHYNGEPDPANRLHQNMINNISYNELLPYIVSRNSNSGWDATNVGVQYQVARAYDYYKNMFGWAGTNGSNARLLVYPTKTNLPGDACTSTFFNYIQFGCSNTTYNHPASEIGVVIHEYTHRVMQNKLLWNLPVATDGKYYGEGNIIKEAYADILGEYGQYYYDDTMDWKTGNQIRKDGREYRDFSRNSYYVDVAGKKHYYRANENSGNTAGMESHEGSTIISHVAYLMDQYGIDEDIAAQIWFRSIGSLKGYGPTAVYSFKNCRTAVNVSAIYVINSNYSNSIARKKLQLKVHSAFNYAKIFPSTSYKMGDINDDGVVNNSDVTFISNLISNSNLWNNYTAEQLAKGDVNYDGVINANDRNKLSTAIAQGTQNNL